MKIRAGRRWRFGIRVLIATAPLAVLGIGAAQFLHEVTEYLTAEARLSGVVSVEATRALGREVRIGEFQILGNIWDFTTPKQIKVRDLFVAETPDPGSRPILRAREAHFWFSWSQLLGDQPLMQARLDTIHLNGPEFTLSRDVRGRWNLSPLIQPSDKPSRPFLARLTVTNGTLRYEDAALPSLPKARPKPLVTQLRHIDGVLLVRPDGVVSLDLKGQGESRLVRNLHTVVSILPQGKQRPVHVLAHIQAQSIPLDAINDRLPPSANVRVAAGYGDLDLTVLYTPQTETTLLAQALSVSGTARVSSAKLIGEALPEPLSIPDAEVVFSQNGARWRGKGIYAGTSVALEGTLLNLPWTDSKSADVLPTFRVSGAIPGTEVGHFWNSIKSKFPKQSLTKEALLTLNRMKGSGRLRFHLAGNTKAPVAEANLSFDTLQSGTYRANDIQVYAVYAENTARAQMRARLGGGELVARGEAQTKSKGTYRFEVRGRKLDIASLQTTKDPVRGTLQLDAIGRGSFDQRPHIHATLEAGGLEYRGQSLSALIAEAELIGPDLLVHYLRAEDPKGYLIAHGTVNLDVQALDLKLAANELDFGSLLQAYRQSQPPQPLRTDAEAEPVAFEGIAYLRGQDAAAARLTGSWDKPMLRGRVNVFNARVGDVEFDRVDAAFDLGRDRFVLSQGNAQRNLGSLFFSGLLSDYMSEKPVYTLTARAADLEVNDLLRLAGQKPESLELTGTLSTEDIQITGEGAEVRVREPFTLTLEGATIKGLPIDNALAKLFYDNQKVQIQEAQASLAAGALRLEGTISREGALDLTLLVQDEDLARLTTAFSEGTSGWQGRLDARARILGTMDDPRITLNLNAEEVAFNAFAFGDLQGAARFQEKRLTVENFTLLNLAGEEAQGGRFEIPDLMYDIQSRELKGRANWSNVMLPRLRDLLLNIQMTLPDAPQEGADWSKLTQNLYNAMAPLDGATTGNIQISGSDRDPQIALHWEDTDLTLDRYPVTLKQGSAQINAQSLMIPHLTLTTEDGKIEGKITKLEFGGEIEAELTALGFNLNFLRHWLSGEDAPRITGTGTIGIAATGKTASPDIRASVNVNEVRINDIAFDHVNLDDISLSNGVIQSESLSVIKGRTIARGTGKVEGFVWEAPFLPKTAKTSFTLELLPRNAEDQNLPIISEFAPGVLDPQSSGQFALRVGITGTVENPLDTIQGSLTLKASRLQIPGFATGLSNVDGELRFDGDRVTVERFQGATKIYSQAVAANQNVEAPFTLSGSLPHGFGAKAAAASPEDGIRLQSRKTQFRESPLPGTKSGGVRGIADVSLLLSGSLKQPFLSGIIDISEANLILPRDFGTPPSGDLRFPVDPKLDVTVRLGRDVRLTSSQLNARTDGSVNLNGSLASPGLSGQLTLREGQLIFPTARFNLLPEGRIRVAYPEYTVGPTGQRGEPELSLVVDVQAQTTLSAVSLNGTPRLYQITATARGPLTGTRIDLRTGRPLLNLQFATNPPDLAGSQAALTDRVLGLLGGDALQPSGRDTGQSLTEQVTSMFTGSVLSGVLDRPARSLGFDTLALSVGGGQNLNFSVSRRIFGPLYISYDRSLSAVRELYILRASLRFRNNYQVSYEVNERNEQRGLLEGIWRF